MYEPGNDTETRAFERTLSRDVAGLVRAARQLSAYAREDVLRGDVDAAMQALALMDVRIAGIDRFIADFLRYRRAGRRAPSVARFRLDALVASTFRRVGAPATATLDVAAGIAPVLADRPLAADVLDEVLGNAVAHHPEPTRLRIGVQIGIGDDGRAVIEVTDNGPGIPEAAASRVFEPFVTLSGDAGRRGLGLAWCRRALAAAGGYIELAAAPRGTRVVIGLPIGVVGPDARDVDAPAAPAAGRPHLRLV